MAPIALLVLGKRTQVQIVRDLQLGEDEAASADIGQLSEPELSLTCHYTARFSYGVEDLPQNFNFQLEVPVVYQNGNLDLGTCHKRRLGVKVGRTKCQVLNESDSELAGVYLTLPKAFPPYKRVCFTAVDALRERYAEPYVKENVEISSASDSEESDSEEPGLEESQRNHERRCFIEMDHREVRVSFSVKLTRSWAEPKAVALSSLLENAGEMGDILLKAQDGSEHHAHSVVLARVPFSKSYLKDSWEKKQGAESQKFEVPVACPAGAEAVRLFLQYVYGENKLRKHKMTQTLALHLLNLAGLYGVDALSKDVVELVKVTESSLDTWTDWLSHDRDEKLVRPLHVAVAQMTKKVIGKATRWDELSVQELKAVQQVAKRARTQEERPSS